MQRIMGIVGALTHAIDRFSPPASRGGSSLRTRLLSTFSISVVFWIPFLSLVLASTGARSTAAVVGIFGLSTGIAPLVMRRFGVGLGGNVASACALLTIGSASFLNGGPALNTHMTLAVVPVLAASLSGMRAALMWTGAVLVTTVGLYLADLNGVVFPQDIPMGYRWAFQLISSCAFATILVAFALMYEYSNEEYTSALSAREADLSAIVETAPDGLLVIDIHGRLLQVNPAAERLFGTPIGSLVGSSVELLFPGCLLYT
ncbi:MAG: PAS domain-containing protein, partial [Myxococcota bacterium]